MSLVLKEYIHQGSELVCFDDISHKSKPHLLKLIRHYHDVADTGTLILALENCFIKLLAVKQPGSDNGFITVEPIQS